MKDCTTCKYGYEDEQMGFPMCHHPKRFSEDCIDFNLHEEKESEHIANPGKTSTNDLVKAAEAEEDRVIEEVEKDDRGCPYISSTHVYNAFVRGAKWDREQMMKEAAEGEVRKDGTIGYLEFSNDQQFHSLLEQFQDCDKVRIIIVKED